VIENVKNKNSQMSNFSESSAASSLRLNFGNFIQIHRTEYDPQFKATQWNILAGKNTNSSFTVNEAEQFFNFSQFTQPADLFRPLIFV
jgi:hypothetical protein